MESARVPFVIVGSTAALVACAGDFAMPLILAPHYPSYSHLQHPESLLGAGTSPVAAWMNGWWICFGVLILLFAGAFGWAYRDRGLPVAALTIQLAVFGALAGIAAGVFPMDVGGRVTLSGRLHGMLSSAGFGAIFLAPAMCMAIFRPPGHWAIFLIAMATQALAVVTGWQVVQAGATKGQAAFDCPGLWQRLFLLNCYIFISALAIHTIVHVRAKN